MTREEWLACNDPGPMLAFALHDRAYGGPVGFRLGDRKLRLFACACHRLSGLEPLTPAYARMEEEGEAWHENAGAGEAVILARLWAENMRPRERVSQAQKAHLLREVVGDPFAPVKPPRKPLACARCGRTSLVFIRGAAEAPISFAGDVWRCKECRHEQPWPPDCMTCPWLTPTVLSLA